MTDKPLRRGRRDNGLSASEYAVAADVDPRVGEHLLDLLANDHIAAYLQPTADVTPGMLSTILPSRPTDRLYVDRERLGDARDHVRQLGAEALSSDDLDARFAELVAQLESDEDGDPPREPSTAGRGSGVTDLRLPRLRSALPDAEPEEPSLLDALDADFSDEDDEGYEPPPPPPLPPISRPTALSLLVMAIGLVVLFWPPLLGYLGIHNTQAPLLITTASLIGGGAGLVWQLRPGRDEDDDPANGAQV
ncbi:MAG: DUF308 domain-containing protein [Micromonosporaceae bacterium]|nr:DUF308 domain-containing protein [Micromonosporaceae bacterium]